MEVKWLNINMLEYPHTLQIHTPPGKEEVMKMQICGIRYYFPKGTDFNTISNQELKSVEWEFNNRPRKRLNYMKPIEVWNEAVHLKGLQE